MKLALNALETVHQYFEYAAVVDQAIFDKIYECNWPLSYEYENMPWEYLCSLASARVTKNNRPAIEREKKISQVRVGPWAVSQCSDLEGGLFSVLLGAQYKVLLQIVFYDWRDLVVAVVADDVDATSTPVTGLHGGNKMD
ncbi:hypothetical protein EVAR_495_1 [Eumeta japonica]|uniref:Uncharacterized protein n=1 Tax=Eumeta variegata TaxID=151549 RepID=A0A4C1SDM2_EUMVA|nr:hypothetical protein EVAR_495_1 [Eumeta japonica]